MAARQKRLGGEKKMIKEITAREIHSLLRSNVRSRPDLGLRNAVADRVLEPANPFEPRASRSPKRWFILFCLLAFLAATCFLYFDVFEPAQDDMNPAQPDRYELEAGH
jgi:hypothetical protein